MQLATIAQTALAVIGIRAAETPKYLLRLRDGRREIRDYPPYLVARTRDRAAWRPAVNANFRRLAGYIFGQNAGRRELAMTTPVFQRGQSLAMTAPVLQARDGEGWSMEFVMPAKFTLETLPRPLDARIEIAQQPAMTLAALRYGGSPSEAVIAERQRELLDWLARGDWRAMGTPFLAQYDPPFTLPFLKRNEVMVRVEQRTPVAMAI